VTGGFPASVTLSDGKNFAITNNPFVVGVKPAQTTTYELSAVKNDCGTGAVSGTARIIILEPLATEETVQDGINVFPNPAREKLTVEFLSPQPANSVISLVDMTGRVLQQNTAKVNQGKQEFIDLTPFNTGSYIVKIKVGEKVVSRKVVITN
ncbi:MAG TPA: T9SS type A sorting domain-containing protein, partial [Emticicia sp.]